MVVIRGKKSVCALICIIEVAVGVPVKMTNHEKKILPNPSRKLFRKV